MSDKPPLSSLKFRGANAEALYDHTHELVLSGPADTGKTVVLTAKALVIASKVPGVHGALVRKTFNSLQESVVKTYKRLIKGLEVKTMGGERVEKFIFGNGSEIVLIGMDNPDKLLSSEWDFIQVCQSEELKQAEWEIAASRVTGRGAVFKNPQIFGDCNPSASRHWIRTRKTLKLLMSRQTDNPELYQDDGQLTAEGAKRMGLAESMYTGVRRQRLLLGIWATAEGAVYEMFNPEYHVFKWDEARLGKFKEVALALDEGFTNPAVIVAVGIDADGRMHIFKEFYKSGVLQNEVVAKAVEWNMEFGGQCYTVCDEAAAGLIADLVANKVPAVGGKGRVEGIASSRVKFDSIQAVQNRLKVQKDGRPRLSVDPACVNVINEFESYHWKPGTDEPEKEDDHSMDALRYLVAAREKPTGAFSGPQDFFRTGAQAGAAFGAERYQADGFRLDRSEM